MSRHPTWAWVTRCIGCGYRASNGLHQHVIAFAETFKKAKTSEGWTGQVAAPPAEVGCPECGEKLWNTKVRPKSYLPVDEGEYL